MPEGRGARACRPAGHGVLVACQGPAAELLLAELPPLVLGELAHPWLSFWSGFPPPTLLHILCQIQRSASQRKACDVFPMAGEPCVGVGKVSKEQVLGVMGPPQSLSRAYPQNTLLAEAGVQGRSDSSSWAFLSCSCPKR